MIRHIAKKEFLLNLMTFKFAVGTVLCVILIAVFTYVLLGDYQQRLESYNKAVAKNADQLRQVRVYENLEPTIYRPPAVLSIFSEGVEKQMGNSVKIELSSVPEIRAGYAEDNPLLSIFPLLDVSLIFKLVLSVLALLLAYDVISGEKEQGTLRLMLAQTVARHQVLLGKLLAGWLTLAIPITMAFIVALLILQVSPMVGLRGSDWVRIGLIYLVSLIFVSAIFNFGLLFSCLTKRSSTTLMFVLFFWVIFTVVIPNVSVYVATQFQPTESVERMDGEVKALQDELWKEVWNLWNKHGLSHLSGTRCNAREPWGYYLKTAERRIIETRRRRYPLQVPLQIKYADNVWEVQRRYLNSLTKQKRLADNLSRSSPISMYEHAISALSGTDLGSFKKFVRRARRYRNTVIEHIRSKTEGFSSLSYFTVATEEDIDAFTEAVSHGKSLDSWISKKTEDFPPLDVRDFTRFTYKTESAPDTVQRMLPDLVLLIFANILFFLLAFAAFLRYDVR